MPLEKALLIEPYGCSKHAVDRAQIGSEDVVVISGAGTLGLGMITYARMRNPALLIALDLADNRLEKAKEFGADLVMNPQKEDVTKKVLELTEGYGCDIYIEATGHPSSVQQGLNMIRKLGRFVEFSVFGQPATIDWSIIGDRKELDVLGSHLRPLLLSLCDQKHRQWQSENGRRGIRHVSHRAVGRSLRPRFRKVRGFQGGDPVLTIKSRKKGWLKGHPFFVGALVHGHTADY